MRKVIVVLIAAVVIASVFTGCIGNSGDSGGGSGNNTKKEGVKKTGKTTFKGWADSDKSGYESPAKLSTSLQINDSNLVKITFNIKVEDDDETHGDENSDADTVDKGEIKSGNFSAKLQKGDTPYSASISFPSSNQTLKEGEFLPQAWDLSIDATCRGEITYDLILIYFYTTDEGFAWNVEAQYEYIDYNATAS